MTDTVIEGNEPFRSRDMSGMNTALDEAEQALKVSLLQQKRHRKAFVQAELPLGESFFPGKASDRELAKKLFRQPEKAGSSQKWTQIKQKMKQRARYKFCGRPFFLYLRERFKITMNKKKKSRALAPAGSFDSLKAAGG